MLHFTRKKYNTAKIHNKCNTVSPHNWTKHNRTFTFSFTTNSTPYDILPQKLAIYFCQCLAEITVKTQRSTATESKCLLNVNKANNNDNLPETKSVCVDHIYCINPCKTNKTSSSLAATAAESCSNWQSKQSADTLLFRVYMARESHVTLSQSSTVWN